MAKKFKIEGVIEHCEHCPHFRDDTENMGFRECGYECKRFDSEFAYESGVPEWCPLDDAEEQK